MKNKDATLSEVLSSGTKRYSPTRNIRTTLDENKHTEQVQHSEMFSDGVTSPNSLLIDRNCASCSGFAPSILKHIKIACLSYVNNPITFGKQKVKFPDMISVKEMILKKCEAFSDELVKIKQVGSMFGDLTQHDEALIPSMHKININLSPLAIANTELRSPICEKLPSERSEFMVTDYRKNTNEDYESSQAKLHAHPMNLKLKRRDDQSQIDRHLTDLFNENKPKYQVDTLVKLISEVKPEAAHLSPFLEKVPAEDVNISQQDIKHKLFKILKIDKVNPIPFEIINAAKGQRSKETGFINRLTRIKNMNDRLLATNYNESKTIEP